MSDIVSGFPKNLAYNIKKLDAGFSKTKIKLIPDIGSGTANTVAANGIIRFRITGNGLYDFRSLCMYFRGSATNTAGNPVHFPRYSSSLIENISITANNTTLCSISQYNLLYNTLMDLEGADISQMAKRDAAGERHDPSVRYSETAGGAANSTLAVVSSVANGTTADTNINMCINNWLGIFGSLSTSIVDLSDWGDLYVNIQLAPAQVLFAGANANAITTDQRATGANYTLDTVFMTIDRCSFQDPLYYSLKTEKLLSPEGLSVAFYDYFTTNFQKTQKSSSVFLNWNINSASLDQIIMTLRHNNFNDTAVHPLILYGANGSTAANNKTFREVLYGVPTATVNDDGTIANAAYQDNLGDAFNNSLYFVRNGMGHSGSKFQINNVDIDSYYLTPLEVYNKVLQYLGFNNIDMGASGIHAGCMSQYHFAKYYFADICDLTNITTDGAFWVSGLDGRGTGINCAYNAQFTGQTDNVFPVAFCRSTKILTINAGRLLTLDKV